MSALRQCADIEPFLTFWRKVPDQDRHVRRRIAELEQAQQMASAIRWLRSTFGKQFHNHAKLAEDLASAGFCAP